MTAPAFDAVSAARALEAVGVKGTCGVGTGAIPNSSPDVRPIE